MDFLASAFVLFFTLTLHCRVSQALAELAAE